MEKEITTVDQVLPNRLLLIALNGRPIFPGIFTPLMVNTAEDLNVIERAYESDGLIGLVLQNTEVANPEVADLHKIGCVARIMKKVNLPDGGVNVFISTIKRFKIKRVLSRQNPMSAAVEYIEDLWEDPVKIKAYARTLLSEMKEIAENNPLFSEEMRLNMVNIDNPGKIADFIASVLNLEKEEQQKILEEADVLKRIYSVLIFVKREQELLHIQKKIQNELNERIEKSQREHFLREELDAIKNELNIPTDAKNRDYEKFKEKIEALNFTGEIKETLDDELDKFALLEPSSPEYTVSRNYLDLVASLPWRDNTVANFSLTKAKKTLENDHYGMEDVKKRIFEYLSVRKMKNDNKGAIILLVGPPGVGKTSVGKSIARAMNKPFFRFSVGGLTDADELKGHRRTYIGALPGKILQGLKITKSRSPVFMIDEVDKMGHGGNRGDPASVLLEILDPEQNSAFRDYYLDLPFDLSDVLFILTANTLDNVLEPLLDRAEIINLSGYVDQEKVQIAKKYLVPKSLKKNGLQKNQVVYSSKILLEIANFYARESGVRNMEACLDKIHRKYTTELLENVDFKTVEAKDGKMLIDSVSDEETRNLLLKEKELTDEDLKKYLGKPPFSDDDIKKADVAGTAIGLAWTSMGGDTMIIESVAMQSSPGKGGLQLTGQLGDVMKESAMIAKNWISAHFLKKGKITPRWLETHSIHLHVPEGATPKDGPSAGITMATALYSLITGKKIRPNLAMTGELSLTGQVLPIGGLKEKTVAAKRNKIRKIIIPKANMRDLEKIPENVKKGLTFYPVSRMEEVLEIAFGKAK